MEIYCCLQGTNLLSLPELGVFSHMWQSTAQHWRGTQTFWQRCITCTSSQGRAGCPEQRLRWWRESFLKCTNWRSLGRQGLAGSPPLGQAPQCLWLLGLPRSLVCLCHGLPCLLWQPRRVRQDRGAPAQLPQRVQHHYLKKKPRKHQEKLLIWLIFLLWMRAPLDSYKCKLNNLLKGKRERIKQWCPNRRSLQSWIQISEVFPHYEINHTAKHTPTRAKLLKFKCS